MTPDITTAYLLQSTLDLSSTWNSEPVGVLIVPRCLVTNRRTPLLPDNQTLDSDSYVHRHLAIPLRYLTPPPIQRPTQVEQTIFFRFFSWELIKSVCFPLNSTTCRPFADAILSLVCHEKLFHSLEADPFQVLQNSAIDSSRKRTVPLHHLSASFPFELSALLSTERSARESIAGYIIPELTIPATDSPLPCQPPDSQNVEEISNA